PGGGPGGGHTATRWRPHSDPVAAAQRPGGGPGGGRTVTLWRPHSDCGVPQRLGGRRRTAVSPVAAAQRLKGRPHSDWAVAAAQRLVSGGRDSDPVAAAQRPGVGRTTTRWRPHSGHFLDPMQVHSNGGQPGQPPAMRRPTGHIDGGGGTEDELLIGLLIPAIFLFVGIPPTIVMARRIMSKRSHRAASMHRLVEQSNTPPPTSPGMNIPSSDIHEPEEVDSPENHKHAVHHFPSPSKNQKSANSKSTVVYPAGQSPPTSFHVQAASSRFVPK
ncbi:hypothetical protein CYMTET_16311, partial [Cymbomonas tetramitiformis]